MNSEDGGSPYERPADDEIEWVSRAEMKREAERMRILAERLTTLSEADLVELELPEGLLLAIREARRLTKPDARKRQLRHVGKQLQKLDSDRLTQRLELFDASSDIYQQITLLCERWRDDLLTDSDALTRLLDSYPTADRQHLRQLVLNVKREQDKETPGPQLARQRKKLLQTLRELITEHFPANPD